MVVFVGFFVGFIRSERFGMTIQEEMVDGRG
jgi:hypothetical protein